MEITNAEILEMARRRAGIPQKEMAQALGVSLPTYSRWIKGNFDDVLLIHAHTFETILKVKFSVITGPQGKTVKITM